MSTVEFGRDQGHDFEESDFDRRVKQVVNRMLREPAYLPDEYKAWLKLHLEQVGLQIPISQINGNFLVEDTAAKLGGNIHGRNGMVRAGTTPYNFFQLTYDGVYEKWVSNFWVGARMSEVQSTTDTSYTFDGAGFSPAIIPYSDFTAAGLDVQVRLMGFLGSSNASGVTTATVGFQTYDADDVQAGFTSSSWSISNTGTSFKFKDSGWQDHPSVTDKDVMMFGPVFKTNNASYTAIAVYLTVLARWIN